MYNLAYKSPFSVVMKTTMNIHEVTSKELAEIHGIGKTTIGVILAKREEHGGELTLDDFESLRGPQREIIAELFTFTPPRSLPKLTEYMHSKESNYAGADGRSVSREVHDPESVSQSPMRTPIRSRSAEGEFQTHSRIEASSRRAAGIGDLVDSEVLEAVDLINHQRRQDREHFANEILKLKETSEQQQVESSRKYDNFCAKTRAEMSSLESTLQRERDNFRRREQAYEAECESLRKELAAVKAIPPKRDHLRMHDVARAALEFDRKINSAKTYFETICKSRPSYEEIKSAQNEIDRLEFEKERDLREMERENRLLVQQR